MRKNIFLDTKWQKNHFNKIKNKADLRYTPELNVTLDITRYFDAISKNDRFIKDIKNKINEIKKQNVFSNIKDEKICQLIKELSNKFNLLLKIFSEVDFKNNVLWEIIQDYCSNIDEIGENIIRIIYEQKQGDKLTEEENTLMYSLRQMIQAVRLFTDYSYKKYCKLSNMPILLLTGNAGSGKTHLLCDIFQLRLSEKKPTLFLFGEDFQDSTKFWKKILNEIGDKSIKNKTELLSLLNKAGESSNQRSLIIIDALNESKKEYWKRNIESVISDISKYPNVSLAVSIRNGYEKIITRNTNKKFIQIEHYGFEGDTIWDATKIYFNHYKIKFNDFPLLNPEFRNPLFLKFFCEKFENTRIGNVGHSSLKDVFEHFVKKKGKEVVKNIPPRNKKINSTDLWNLVIKGSAIKMADKGRDYIYEGEIKNIIQKYYSIRNSIKILNELKKKFLIEIKVKNKTSFKFLYNKFSDHLIVRYILGNYVRPNNRVKAFHENGKIGKMLKKFKNESGILEAFFIQTPEFCGKNLFELAPYLKKEYGFNEALVDSIIWIPSNCINEKLVEVIERNCLESKDYFIETLITLSSVPEHKLNALFLDKILSKFDMPKRDSWWTIYINDNFNADSSIDRLIQWCWDNSKKYKEKDSIFLTGIILSWFLTSSNRFLRDKSTKALTLILKDNQDILLKILKHFEKVNDPYIKERLYAVMYGSVLTNNSSDQNLKEISQYIYDIEFKKRSPTTHILIRDYALQTILFCIKKGIRIDINSSNLKYPFKSSFPRKVITEKKLEEKYYPQSGNISNQEKGILRLWGSVMRMGDFSRYVLGTNHKSMFQWSGDRIGSVKKNVDFDLSIAERWIFNKVMKLGWDIQLHGNYDFRISRSNYKRSDHKIERIGKKYQWIAYHEFISRVADNFIFKGDIFSGENIDYNGAWRPHFRDIDPSFLLTAEPLYPKIKKPEYKFKEKPEKWIKKKSDIFPLRKLIELKDDKKENWFILEGNASWIKEIDGIAKRDMGFYIRSHIIKRRNYGKMMDWLKDQGFLGGSVPESKRFYEIFLGEYFKSKCYSELNKGSSWINNSFPNSSPCKIMPSSERYFNEFTLDCSHDDSVNINLPENLIVNKLNLNHKNFDGMFYDKSGQLICFSNSIFESNPYNGLFISKAGLKKLLKENDYCLIWIILGDKMEIKESFKVGKSKGRLNMQGIYGYDGLKLIGSTKKKFENGRRS